MFQDKEERRIVLVFLIDSLNSREGLIGGTERQLIEQIKKIDRKKFRPILVCLRENIKIPILELLSCEKVVLNVYSFKSIKSFFSLLHFLRFLKKNDVDILQAFFFDSILFGIT